MLTPKGVVGVRDIGWCVVACVGCGPVDAAPVEHTGINTATAQNSASGVTDKHGSAAADATGAPGGETGHVGGSTDMFVGTTGVDDSPPLSSESHDEFGADLSAWSVLDEHRATLAIEAGALVFAPHAHTLWYNDSSGPFVYQLYAGNISVTARVDVHSIASPLDLPQHAYWLGGLMARSASSQHENYVFIGFGDEAQGLFVEHKSTVNGASTWGGPSWLNASGELRLCRVGTTFDLLVRSNRDSDWVLVETHERPDLPNELQVGPVAFANTSSPDVRARYEYVAVTSVSNRAQCSQ